MTGIYALYHSKGCYTYVAWRGAQELVDVLNLSVDALDTEYTSIDPSFDMDASIRSGSGETFGRLGRQSLTFHFCKIYLVVLYLNAHSLKQETYWKMYMKLHIIRHNHFKITKQHVTTKLKVKLKITKCRSQQDLPNTSDFSQVCRTT